MNANDLQSAAERWESDTDSAADACLLAEFSANLLSPGPESIDALGVYLDAHTEPVTEEWLRDVWGWYVWGDEHDFSAAPLHDDRCPLRIQTGYLSIGGGHVSGTVNQGQFTFIALGLGLQPKTKV